MIREQQQNIVTNELWESTEKNTDDDDELSFFIDFGIKIVEMEIKKVDMIIYPLCKSQKK